MTVLPGQSVPAPAADAIPRDYNFADDILGRNLPPAAPAGPPIIDPRGTWTYGQLADRVARFGHALRSLGIRPRGAHADLPARHHRLADRLPRRHQGRRRRGPGQHADDRGRLPLHAGRQPRARAGRLAGAVSEIREAHRPAFPDLARDRRVRRDRVTAIVSLEDLLDSIVEAVAQADAIRTPRRPPATTSRSGSTPRARPASRRRRCTCTPTCSSPTISTPRRSSALTENDVCYSVAKLFFAYGLGNAMTFPLSVGATTVLLPDRPTPDAVAADPAPASGDGVLRGADLLRRVPGEPGGAAARRT